MPIVLARPVLKGEFYEGWHYVPLLLVSAAIGCISSFFGTFYIAVKKNKMAMVTTVIGAIVNITLNLLFIKSLGIVSAIVASVVSFSVITILRIISTAQYTRVECKWVGVVAQFALLIIQPALWLCNVPYAMAFEIALFGLLVCLNLKSIMTIGRKGKSYMLRLKKNDQSC